MPSFKNIYVTELKSMLQHADIHMVDMRTDAEVARGKIPESAHLPLHLIAMRQNELDKAKPTVFYCQMGGRSGHAAVYAAANGFFDVYNLQGGIAAVMQDGLPASA